LNSLYIKDIKRDPEFLKELYQLSRSKYNRSLLEIKKVLKTQHKDVIHKIEKFAEPII
jgi:hypothetical protein